MPSRTSALRENDIYILGERPFVGRDDLVPERIHFGVDGLKFRMCFEPSKTAPQSFRPLDLADEIRDKTPDLAIVKYDAVGLIANQAANRLRPIVGDQIRGDVNYVRFQAEGSIYFEMNLVPAENFIRCNLKCLADSRLLP